LFEYNYHCVQILLLDIETQEIVLFLKTTKIGTLDIKHIHSFQHLPDN